jgi:hypothetical protein
MGSSLFPQKVLSKSFFRTQFNEYSEFKNKSFQYQKLLGKLQFLFSADEEYNKKEIKQYNKNLDELLE